MADPHPHPIHPSTTHGETHLDVNGPPHAAPLIQGGRDTTRSIIILSRIRRDRE